MAIIQVYPYLSPRLIEVLAPDTNITVQELVDLCRDWEDEDENMSFDFLISAAGKEDLGGGLSVAITASLNNAQIFFTPRSTPLDDGTGRTCDATDTTGRQLYVDDATFVTDGVKRGDIVYNQTTGATASVLEVVSETTIDHLGLTGGSSTEWTSGDNYKVYEMVQCTISGGNLVATDDMGADLNPVFPSEKVQVIRTLSSSGTLLFQEYLVNQAMSPAEKDQWRDALGVDGDKSVARGGQLQKKSEAPYNNTIDTNWIHEDDLNT